MSYNISVDIGSSSNSSPESNALVSSTLSSGGIIELSSDSSPLSSSLYASSRVSDNKLPSLKCGNVIISPVFCLKYVAQGVYVTDGRISIAYE